ncbi:MAG: hypothetical protein CFE47_24005 [Pseudomonas sp. PGPPP1]|nr:MAG: hypothetical protein CFE47_24005 [Pseudomonas sp. PGPPP1]
MAFDLSRPVKPRWPNAGLNPWVTRQDAGLAAQGQAMDMYCAPSMRITRAPRYNQQSPDSHSCPGNSWPCSTHCASATTPL